MARFKTIMRRVFVLPPVALPLLVGVIVGCMVWVFQLGGEGTPLANAAYVASGWALTALCASIAAWARGFDVALAVPEGSLAAKFLFNRVFRSFATTHVSLGVDVLWAAANLASGIATASLWAVTLGAYYLCLAIMRGFLVWRIHLRGESPDRARELDICRVCGGVIMASALPVMGVVVLNLHNQGTFYHHMYITIGVAVYAFAKLGFSIPKYLRFRDGDDLLMLANANIGIACALASFLTMGILMMNVFGGKGRGGAAAFSFIMTVCLGAAVVIVIFIFGLRLLQRTGRMKR